MKKNPYQGQLFTQPSLTIPDQTMSMREIIKRYVRGMSTPVQKTPIYDLDGTSTGLDVRKLDLVEIQELAFETKQILSTEREHQQRKQKEKADKAFEKTIQDRLNELKL